MPVTTSHPPARSPIASWPFPPWKKTINFDFYCLPHNCTYAHFISSDSTHLKTQLEACSVRDRGMRYFKHFGFPQFSSNVHCSQIHMVVFSARPQTESVCWLQSWALAVFMAKQFFYFFQILRPIYQFSRPKHDCYIKFTSCFT